jgi:glutamate--cysteine ligase
VSAIGEIAVLLDDADEGYVAAIEQAQEAFQDPARTPSAGVLRDLEREQATFFEYALALARSHHEYFLALPLDAEHAARFDALAQRSLAEAAALEAARTQSFDEYLRDYFAAV